MRSRFGILRSFGGLSVSHSLSILRGERAGLVHNAALGRRSGGLVVRRGERFLRLPIRCRWLLLLGVLDARRVVLGLLGLRVALGAVDGIVAVRSTHASILKAVSLETFGNEWAGVPSDLRPSPPAW